MLSKPLPVPIGYFIRFCQTILFVVGIHRRQRAGPRLARRPEESDPFVHRLQLLRRLVPYLAPQAEALLMTLPAT